jgi:hypothetical protein
VRYLVRSLLRQNLHKGERCESREINETHNGFRRFLSVLISHGRYSKIAHTHKLIIYCNQSMELDGATSRERERVTDMQRNDIFFRLDSLS